MYVELSVWKKIMLPFFKKDRGFIQFVSYHTIDFFEFCVLIKESESYAEH